MERGQTERGSEDGGPPAGQDPEWNATGTCDAPTHPAQSTGGATVATTRSGNQPHAAGGLDHAGTTRGAHRTHGDTATTTTGLQRSRPQQNGLRGRPQHHTRCPRITERTDSAGLQPGPPPASRAQEPRERCGRERRRQRHAGAWHMAEST